MTDRISNSVDRPSRADWWARLFAIGGLAVGAASLCYSWVRTADLPSTQEIVSSNNATVEQFLQDARKQLAEQDRLEAAARKQRNDLELLAIEERDENFEKFEQRIAELTRTNVAQREADGQTEAYTDMAVSAGGLDPASDTAVTDMAKTDSGAQDTLAGVDPQAAPSSDADTLLEDLLGPDDPEKSLFGADDVATTSNARLQVARRTLRPTSAAGAEIATVSNTTEVDAGVRLIEFVPDSLYEVDSGLPSDSTALAAGDLDIQFVPADNRARDPGKQGTYRRVFAEAVTIPAGSNADVRARIQNSQHLGWGLRGTLVLIYGDRRLEIPSVSVRFVANP